MFDDQMQQLCVNFYILQAFAVAKLLFLISSYS